MGTKNGHGRHPTVAAICVRGLLGPANAVTTSGTWVGAPGGTNTVVGGWVGGAPPRVVWVGVIQVHWLPAARDASQRNRRPSGVAAPMSFAAAISTFGCVSPPR